MSAVIEEKYSLEQIAAAIVAIRGEITKINKEADKKINALKEEKGKLEDYAEKVMEQLGSSSVKTKSGTLISQEKRRYSTTDWDNFYRVVADNDRFDLLEKRISQKNFDNFLEENPDKKPKGINVFVETQITVRSS
tara:strand:- start:4108 stop:4515 length:408 start_codon:yes stop_codon:yes gene_type:complete